MSRRQINLSDQWDEQQAQKRDANRRQVWRINYIVRTTRDLKLEAHIRAETAHEALRALAEQEAPIIEARVRLALDQDRQADNDIDEEESNAGT